MAKKLKKNIQSSLIFFIICITYQWLFLDGIKLGQIIGISISFFIFNTFSDWVNIPYEWKKK